MTLLQVLQSTTAYFQKREIESPRLNAEHLLAHSLGRKRIELYLEFERELAESELAPLRDLVRRRGNGEPLQHLLGTVEFYGLSFLSDKRALIPRPETEELVELVQSTIQNAEARVVDVGTGSGVIALCLAAKFPAAEVHGVDASAEALTLARENAERLGLGARVHWAQGHLLEPVAGRFDIVIANLPYVPAGDRATLSREVLHDPEAALFGGARGDELIRELIVMARSHLRSGGQLALEVGIDQAQRLAEFLSEQGYRDISQRQDFAGVTRFLLARHG